MPERPAHWKEPTLYGGLDIVVGVSLQDIALAVGRGAPLPSPEEPWCHVCGSPGAAHYCPPREAARGRLERYVQEALDA